MPPAPEPEQSGYYRSSGSLSAFTGGYPLEFLRSGSVESAFNGIIPTREQARMLPVYSACIDALADIVSVMPLRFMQTFTETREVNGRTINRQRQSVTMQRLARLWNNAPYNVLSGSQLTRWVFTEILEEGNAYIVIQRDSMGMPVALYPVSATRVTPRWSQTQTPWAKEYFIAYAPATTSEYEGGLTLGGGDVLHFMGEYNDGLLGRPHRETVLRDTILLGLLQDWFVATDFTKGPGSAPAFIFPENEDPTPDEMRQIIENYKLNNTGRKGRDTPFIAGRGLSISSFDTALMGQELLSAREFTDRQIARGLRVTLEQVDLVLSGNIYAAGFREKLRNFHSARVNPMVSPIEREISRKLIHPRNQTTVAAEFNNERVLRLSQQEHTDLIAAQINAGVRTLNEGREELELDPIDNPNADIPLPLLGTDVQEFRFRREDQNNAA